MRIEIRWHGRGGQGAVTAADLYAQAAIMQGYYAQAFPEFGAERRGAPVRAFTRIDTESFIHDRYPIEEPDIVVVLDPMLARDPMIIQGLKKNGLYIANSKLSPSELAKIIGRTDINIKIIDATRIALEVLKRPIVNTAMLGAVAKLVPIVKLEYIEKSIQARFEARLAQLNLEVIRRAFKEVK
ncbi:MAG: pyruvate synthase [Thermoprotei archaeon]|nr:MAG: pyruvate synthase [Thermoprotei archaeon]